MTTVLAETPSASEPIRIGATADESATRCDIDGKDVAPGFVGVAVLRDPRDGGNTAGLDGPIIFRDPISGLVVGALDRGFLLNGSGPPRNCKHGGSCGGVDLGFVVITALCFRDETSLVGFAGSLPSTRSYFNKYVSTKVSR